MYARSPVFTTRHGGGSEAPAQTERTLLFDTNWYFHALLCDIE